MSEPPIFSKIEADRILQRAAEIEGSEDSRPLSIQELRSIAGEAGFGAGAVNRAIVEAQQAASAETRHRPVEKSGFIITQILAVRTIPIALTSEQIMRTVRLLQPYREGPPHVKLEEHEITWKDRRGLRFRVTSSGGVTEVRVFVHKILVRRGRWIGWVRAAVDRLETLAFMVASRDLHRETPGQARISPPADPADPDQA